jgi:hypothetical protein
MNGLIVVLKNFQDIVDSFLAAIGKLSDDAYGHM